jgi:hypothetical protein
MLDVSLVHGVVSRGDEFDLDEYTKAISVRAQVCTFGRNARFFCMFRLLAIRVSYAVGAASWRPSRRSSRAPAIMPRAASWNSSLPLSATRTPGWPTTGPSPNSSPGWMTKNRPARRHRAAPCRRLYRGTRYQDARNVWQPISPPTLKPVARSKMLRPRGTREPTHHQAL